MSGYTFEVQHTGRPFGPAEHIPDHAWKMASRHTSLSAAQKCMAEYDAEMRHYCGPTGWNDHTRIVPLRDTRITYHLICGGWIDEHATSRWCEPWTQADMAVDWKAGESCPPPPTPAGWDSPHQCARCAELEAKAGEYIMAEIEREYANA